MTPQQAISAGAEQFAVVGNDEFNTKRHQDPQAVGFTGVSGDYVAVAMAAARAIPDVRAAEPGRGPTGVFRWRDCVLASSPVHATRA